MLLFVLLASGYSTARNRDSSAGGDTGGRADDRFSDPAQGHGLEPLQFLYKPRARGAAFPPPPAPPKPAGARQGFTTLSHVGEREKRSLSWCHLLPALLLYQHPTTRIKPMPPKP